MISPEQAKEICERKAKEHGYKLFWIGSERAKVYRRRNGNGVGELLCSRPHFPIASKSNGAELEGVRNSITDEIWERFPTERA